MKAFTPIWREWRLFILRWALREINLTSPDVPGIVCEIHYWESTR